MEEALFTLDCRMNVRRRVGRCAGRVRARSAVVAGAQQLFRAALVLVSRLCGQALSRVFPLSRSGEVTEKNNNKQLDFRRFLPVQTL